MLYKNCVAVLLAIVCFQSATFAQEITGPKAAKTSELITLKVLKFEGDDPKYTCIPENNEYKIYKTLDGETEIVFHTKTAKTYTFVLACSVKQGEGKPNKTILLTHAIEVSKAGNTPDDSVKPIIVPQALKDDMKAAYLVSPDAEKRAILLKIYQDVLAQSADFENFGEAGQLLSSLTAKRQGSTTDLRGVKDVVEKYLLTELTGNSKAWSKTKFDEAFTNVITVMAELRP